MFLEDVKLIKDNASKFNGEKSSYSIEAEKLYKYIEGLVKEKSVYL